VKKSAPIKKPVAKSAPKAPAKAVTGKSAGGSNSAAKPSTKQTPVKSASNQPPSAKSAPKAAAPVKAPVPKAAATPAPAPAAKTSPPKTVPVSKSPSKKSTKSNTPPPPAPKAPIPRPTGKVAVAVVSRQSTPAPRGKVKVVEYKTSESTGRPVIPEGYKPGPDEEYMSTLQLEYFRQRLLGWRADLVEESKQTIENLKDEVRDVGDEAERATRETENSLELRTRDRYRKLIGKIDSTLKRLDAGDYGYCADTGEEIGLDRLEVRLTAERTIDAQERWEHLQKQQGE